MPGNFQHKFPLHRGIGGGILLAQEQGQIVCSHTRSHSGLCSRPNLFSTTSTPTKLARFSSAHSFSLIWQDLRVETRGPGPVSCVILPETRRINMSFKGGRVPLLQRRVCFWIEKFDTAKTCSSRPWVLLFMRIHKLNIICRRMLETPPRCVVVCFHLFRKYSLNFQSTGGARKMGL